MSKFSPVKVTLGPMQNFFLVSNIFSCNLDSDERDYPYSRPARPVNRRVEARVSATAPPVKYDNVNETAAAPQTNTKSNAAAM